MLSSRRPDLGSPIPLGISSRYVNPVTQEMEPDQQSLPLTSPFPAISHFFTSLSPSHRRHTRNVQSYLQNRLVESRKKTKSIGPEAAVEMADNTLDMMVAREFRAEDWMPDNEMIDEVLQCE
jgi:hypothetical protein